jgi:hypothetical protein
MQPHPYPGNRPGPHYQKGGGVQLNIEVLKAHPYMIRGLKEALSRIYKIHWDGTNITDVPHADTLNGITRTYTNSHPPALTNTFHLLGLMENPATRDLVATNDSDFDPSGTAHYTTGPAPENGFAPEK